MAVLKSRKYTKGEYAGQTINVPVLISVQFEKDGTLVLEDVEEEELNEFIRLTVDSFDFEVVGDEGEEDDDKKEAAKKKKEDNEKLKEQLDGMDITALSQLLDDAGINREEASKWTDKKLRKELYKKLAA